MGNPFLDDFPELVILDRWNSADEWIVDSLHKPEYIAKKQYENMKIIHIVSTIVSEKSSLLQRQNGHEMQDRDHLVGSLLPVVGYICI